MLKKIVKIIGLFAIIFSLLGIHVQAFAQDDDFDPMGDMFEDEETFGSDEELGYTDTESTGGGGDTGGDSGPTGGDPGTPDEASFAGRCEDMGKTGTNYEFYPPCASSPKECGSQEMSDEKVTYYRTPLNCIFLEEPIGGDPGYDLYKVECFPNPTDESQTACTYKLWHGEVITPSQDKNVSIRGPVQAILAFEEGKEYQGPFGLLYSYLGLIYKFMSGVIVGFVILISIIGGIEMTTSGGDADAYGKGKKRIIKALVGMVLWFLASLILYTINPTFFAF